MAAEAVEDLLIEAHVVILHHPPVPPLKGDSWRATVDFDNFPRKSWHHALESLVAGGKVGVLGTVVLVRSNDGIVRADLQHVLTRLRWSAIDREAVILVVDGAPVLETRLERGLDFPVLDEVLDQLWQAASSMVHLLACEAWSACRLSGGEALHQRARRVLRNVTGISSVALNSRKSGLWRRESDCLGEPDLKGLAAS